MNSSIGVYLSSVLSSFILKIKHWFLMCFTYFKIFPKDELLWINSDSTIREKSKSVKADSHKKWFFWKWNFVKLIRENLCYWWKFLHLLIFVQDKNLFFATIDFGESYESIYRYSTSILSFFKFVFKEEIIKIFTIYEHKTTIMQPYIQLWREKNSCKNSKIVYCNIKYWYEFHVRFLHAL